MGAGVDLLQQRAHRRLFEGFRFEIRKADAAVQQGPRNGVLLAVAQASP